MVTIQCQCVSQESIHVHCRVPINFHYTYVHAGHELFVIILGFLSFGSSYSFSGGHLLGLDDLLSGE